MNKENPIKEGERFWAVLACGREEEDVVCQLADFVFSEEPEEEFIYVSGPMFLQQYFDDGYMAFKGGILEEEEVFSDGCVGFHEAGTCPEWSS